MKVLQFTRDLSRDGGVQRLIYEIAVSGAGGHQVDILITNRASTPDYIDELEAAGVNVFFIPRWNIFKIWCFIRKYDVVHAHLFPALYFTALFARNAIYTEHNTTNNRRGVRWVHHIESYIYSRYKTVTCISPEVQKALLGFLKWDAVGNTQVVYNGVNLERFKVLDTLPITTSSDEMVVNVAMVGSLTEQKDQATIVRALKLMPDNMTLHLGGDGPTRAALEALIEELGLSDRVTFHGVVADVPVFLRSMDIYVQSSKWEGFGLAAIEAMACGLPVLCSDVPGLNSLSEERYHLFPVGGVECLSGLLTRVVNDIEYKDSLLSSSKKTAADFSMAVMIQNMLKLYQKAA